MTADERMSEEIRLEALANHIRMRLAEQGLASPTAAQFREHLAKVELALKRIQDAQLTTP